MKKASHQRASQKVAESFSPHRSTGMRLNEFQQHVTEITAGSRHSLRSEEIQKLFDICDGNQDGALTKKELEIAYQWLSPVVAPVTALIIVDVQNDFLTGSLALRDAPAGEDGLEVVPVINKLLKSMEFGAVAYSFDYHPKNHISFIDNVASRQLDQSSSIRNPNAVKVGDEVIFTTKFGPTLQKIWPTHCVIDSEGAKLDRDLIVLKDSFNVYKGMQPDIESYTAFGNTERGAETTLQSELQSRNVTEVYVTGVAYDVCVGSTVLDALKLGYSVALIEDASRGVSLEGIAKMKKDIKEAGGKLLMCDQVINGDGFTVDDRVATLSRRLARETIATEVKT